MQTTFFTKHTAFFNYPIHNSRVYLSPVAVKDDRAYLLHVRDALARVRMYTVGGKDAFLADPKTQDAVIRNLPLDCYRTVQYNAPYSRENTGTLIYANHH